MRNSHFRRQRPLALGGSGRTVLGPSSVLPELLLIASTGVIVWFCREMLVDAQEHDIELPSLVYLFLSVAGIVLVSVLMVITNSARSARRLVGPVHRITVAMQRTRNADIAHRVHLRRGDALKEIAAEFNRVLEWLNENPPQGVRTGTDVFEFDQADRRHELSSDDEDAMAALLDVVEFQDTDPADLELTFAGDLDHEVPEEDESADDDQETVVEGVGVFKNERVAKLAVDGEGGGAITGAGAVATDSANATDLAGDLDTDQDADRDADLEAKPERVSGDGDAPASGSDPE